MWGSLSAVEIDRDGKGVWVAERCGGNSACLDSPTVDPILRFDASGKLVKSFGAGLLVSPHGIYVDRDGNVWVTDYQDNAPRPARGAAAPPPPPGAGAGAPPAAPAAAARGTGPVGRAAGATKGHQVFKFSPTARCYDARIPAEVDPRLLPANDVIVARNGDIFVSSRTRSRALRDHKFRGREAGQTLGNRHSREFNQPHALAFDQGRLLVGDRNNSRFRSSIKASSQQWTAFNRRRYLHRQHDPIWPTRIGICRP